MSKKIIASTFILFTICIVFITGCYKATTVIIPDTLEITTPVSISTDIIPVFGKSCSLSGCHNSGGLKPDLSVDKAYNSLVNGNYVDLSTPENSQV
jgi:hypothetical protein